MTCSIGRAALAVAFACTVAAASPELAQPVPVTINRSEIAPGVHQFTIAADGYVQQLNSVAIINADDVLVFDTTTRPSTAAQILAEIRKLTAKPVRFVVNSHWHPDHWSGNEVFAAADPRLQIIATEKQRDFMQNVAAMWPVNLPKTLAAEERAVTEQLASGKGADGQPLTAEQRTTLQRDLQQVRDLVAEQAKVRRTYPTLTYNERLTMRHGGREFQFISVTGDAAATTVLYLPRERVLITGDAVSHPLPYFTPPLSEHAKSLRQLAALQPAIVVPGHGPAFRDTAYMLLEAELFEDVLRQVQAALRGGAVSIDDVEARVDFGPFRDRFAKGDSEVATLFPAFTRGMVRRAYIELRDGKEIR